MHSFGDHISNLLDSVLVQRIVSIGDLLFWSRSPAFIAGHSRRLRNFGVAICTVLFTLGFVDAALTDLGATPIALVAVLLSMGTALHEAFLDRLILKDFDPSLIR